MTASPIAGLRVAAVRPLASNRASGGNTAEANKVWPDTPVKSAQAHPTPQPMKALFLRVITRSLPSGKWRWPQAQRIQRGRPTLQGLATHSLTDPIVC